MTYRDYRTSKIMLLGPGKFLCYRKRIRDDLNTTYGVDLKNIIIMEDVEDQQYGTLHDKFVRIIEKYQPNLYVAFFHKDADMQSVIYEIALLSEKFGSELFRTNRLRFLREINFDWENISAYIKSLYPNIPRADFDINSKVEYLKAPKQIHIMAQSILI
jgi:hypothetical protein